jgi:hypothetical protein
MIGRAMLTYLLGLSPAVASAARQPNDLVYRLSFTSTGVACEHFRGGAGPTQGLFSPS